VGASCAFIYVLDTAYVLYAFDPQALTFTTIGPLDCPGVGQAVLPSLAIDDNRVLWATGAKNELYQVDPQNAHCTPTSFPPPPALTDQVGIGFVGDALYLSTEPSLYRVDQPSWQVTDVGEFQPDPAPEEGLGPSLAGTSDGRLFAVWLGPPTVGEIDPSSAAVLWSLPVTTESDKAYAVAVWGGALWLFLIPSTSGSIVRYDLSTNTLTPVLPPGTTPFVLSAAASPACSP
jgi:hypothetical protein